MHVEKGKLNYKDIITNNLLSTGFLSCFEGRKKTNNKF